MVEAVNNLYTVFAHYRLGNDRDGCDCCVGPGHWAELTAKPLRELTYDDLERYSRKAMTTWGSIQQFKHFLPRLLELTIEYRDDFLDLAVVFGKLSYADWKAWPYREQDAIDAFFDEYWQFQIAEPISGAFEDAIDTVLCAISNASPSVQRFLDSWIATRTDDSVRHLASFILNNDKTLIKKGQLSNSFWNRSSTPHSETVAWLLSDAVLEYLDTANDTVLDDDFSYALPQLKIIRSSLSST